MIKQSKLNQFQNIINQAKVFKQVIAEVEAQKKQCVKDADMLFATLNEAEQDEIREYRDETGYGYIPSATGGGKRLIEKSLRAVMFESGIPESMIKQIFGDERVYKVTKVGHTWKLLSPRQRKEN